MPIGAAGPICRWVSVSAPSEVGWILNLLTQTAPYAGAALAELDASLLPGVGRLRGPIAERTRQLWQDGHPGCTELLVCADLAGSMRDGDSERLIAWLRSGAGGPADARELITETPEERAIIGARLQKLRLDRRSRDTYAGILGDVWALAAPAWVRHGRSIAVDACAAWERRLVTGTSIEELVPPRHPLARADAGTVEHLFARRVEFALSPLYFCTSGGHLVDLGDYVHLGVAASDLLPTRRTRDADFIADRLRVLAEPTRVRILLEVLSAPAGVMELARSLRISQPTVSGHLKALREAGLIRKQRDGARGVFVASLRNVERLLEAARATIARWE